MLPATKREGVGESPADAVRFDPVPGTIVAEKYRVERTLGEGGMGLVVAATHLGLEQPVAIKFLLPEAMRSTVAVERFLREAKVAAKVKSEYVARVHDVGTLEDSRVPYIVMEHLEGCDLGALIARDGALAIEEACEIALQACEALAEVHAAGIVHRDLKPSNLFVTRRADGSPAAKLLDFGISKLGGVDDTSIDPALTTTAAILGSPAYMSPEQLKSTKEVDRRTDVWSLGAVLYEAVTGRPAFRGETVPQVCAMIASEQPPAPSSIRASVPPELERIIRHCLAKNPDERAELVDLAGVLARLAPERARGSLERIGATLGTSERRPRTSGVTIEAKTEPLPVLPLATSGDEGMRSEWDRTGGRRSERSGRGALGFLVLVGGSLLGVGLLTGRIGIGGLRGGVHDLSGQLAGATSAVTSAAEAVSSAVASSLPEVPSAIPALPSGLPPLPTALPALPFGDPTPTEVPQAAEGPTSGSAAASESEEPSAPPAPVHGDEPPSPPRAASPAVGPNRTPTPAPKPHLPSKHHSTVNKWHHHH